MLNPYTLLTRPILDAMLRQPMYFVRQRYPRGASPFDDEKTIPLLLTHYAHHETDHERVQRHMRLLMTDPYRCVYNSMEAAHLDKLRKAASQPSGYRVYINLLPSKWKAGDGLKRKINQYLVNKLPWWHYSPADKLKVTLKERYGELYLALLWKGQQTEVILSEIENFRLCATT